MKLLRDYAANQSEEAFAALVARHVNLVHSVALRLVSDSHLAEEITQSVFILLARKAAELDPKTILAGWLCRTARYVSANMLTIQRRRLARETQAVLQQDLEATREEDWKVLGPVLDDALSELGETDHNAIVLRFFEGRSFYDIGTALGASEGAAKKRVGRALERLRVRFKKRGIAFSAAAIAHAVSAHSVQAAPLGLAASVTKAAIHGTVATSAISPLLTTTLKSTTHKLMALTNLKTAAICGGVVLLLAGGSIIVSQGIQAPPHTPNLAAPGLNPASADYTTPESAFKSAVDAMSAGNWRRLQSSLTSEQLDRIKKKFEGQTEAEIKSYLLKGGAMMASYQIIQREVISDEEVRLLVEVQPSPEHDHIGHDLQVMKKSRNEWKWGGKWGVDVK